MHLNVTSYVLCPAMLETNGFHVLNWKFRGFALFNVNFKRGNCPSARNASAANAFSRDIGIFNGRPALINDLLNQVFLVKIWTHKPVFTL